MAELKDSGERTKFSTGAVRDMHDGKGRFDLLPWYAIHEVAKHCEDGAKKYGERNVDKGIPQHSLIDSAIRHLVRYLHNEQDEPHLRAAAWNVLWALEQETTHPELNDLPWRNSHDDEGKGETTERDDTAEIATAIQDKCADIIHCIDCPLRDHVHHKTKGLRTHDCTPTYDYSHLLEHYKIMFGKDWGEE